MTSPTEDTAPAPPATITLKSGRLYIPGAVHDRYFSGLTSVILMRRENDLHILPVRFAAAGGYVIKIRNAAGDRLVEAMDFFRSNELGDDIMRDLPVVWSSESAALVAAKAFEMKT